MLGHFHPINIISYPQWKWIDRQVLDMGIKSIWAKGIL